jgi:hypothetical protein
MNTGTCSNSIAGSDVASPVANESHRSGSPSVNDTIEAALPGVGESIVISEIKVTLLGVGLAR